MGFILRAKLIGVFYLLVAISVAQKPSIDANSINNWPSLRGAIISSNGKYVSYSIINIPIGSNTLVIQNVETGLKFSSIGAGDCHFSSDSRKAYFQLKDTLCIVSLGKQNKTQFISIGSMKYPTGSN